MPVRVGSSEGLGVCGLEITVLGSDSVLRCSCTAAHYKLCGTFRKTTANLGITRARHALAQSDLSVAVAEPEHAVPGAAWTDALAATWKLAGREGQRVAVDLHVCSLV